jgi:hypothetical protein
MSAEESVEYDELERRMAAAWQVFDELMRVAMGRRGTDDD